MKYLITFSCFCAQAILAIYDDEPNLIGGSYSYISDFPYQASLQIEGEHICGGGIISNKHILTAAHCTLSKNGTTYTNLKVITGTTNLLKLGHLHNVCQIKNHPEFNEDDSVKNDISVLTICIPMTFSESQWRVLLPIFPTKELSFGYIAGWGSQVYKGDEVTPRIQKLKVTIVENDYCQKHSSDFIYPEHLCGYSGYGNGIALGDSGSPLVVHGRVVGIASWTTSERLADIYTRVFSFKQFIEEIMEA